MKERNTNNVLKGAVAGLIGGIVASFVMEKFQAVLSDAIAKDEEKSEKKKKAKKSEKEANDPATVKAAEAISEAVFDHRLTKSEKEPVGEAAHYAFGATTGLLYGVAAEVAPITNVGMGLPFGAALWLVADEIAVPALGLSKSPLEYPPSSHGYALASHLVYGLTTDLTRRAVRQILE